MNNTQVDNAKGIDIVMPMYNLIEYSDNYSKTYGSLWQYCKNIRAVNNDGNIVDPMSMLIQWIQCHCFIQF